MDIVYKEDGRYGEYESLLLDRDRYRKEADCALREYIRVFGDRITAVFRQKIACIERKKMLSYCMVYRNRGESVDMDEVQERLKQDIAEYNEMLRSMIRDNEACKNMRRIPQHYLLKIKQIYRRIARKLHPDLNPLTEQHQELMELWQRNLTAYNCNDLKELEEVEILVDKALADLGQGSTEITIPDIDGKIIRLQREIEEIRSTDPYLYKEILADPELVKEKEQELDDELKEYEDYAKQLEQQLRQFIVDGGTLTWMSGQN